MLLHGREAHRVVARQLGNALLGVDGAAHDVSASLVRQRAEHEIEVGGYGLHRYNHTVVGHDRQVATHAADIVIDAR
jgi:hypothetical protein